MAMGTHNPGDAIAAAHQNAIVNALKGTTGENLTVFAKGADIVSASALVLGTDGNYFHVTGTVTITSISTLPAGTAIRLEFDGALTLTHNATTLIMQGATNYTTSAGDVFDFISEGSGNWRETGRSLSATTAAVGSTSYSVASQYGATPSLTFGTTNTAGTGTAFVRRNAQIALYDTTVARAVTFGDVGTVGSSGGFAAHVLHGHPFALGASIVASTGNVLQVSSTNGNLAWSTTGIDASPITNAVASNVLFSQNAYVTGPSCAQGATGTWFASGQVTITFNAVNDQATIRLWDGVTVIAESGAYAYGGGGQMIAVPVSGYLASPAGNIRISVQSDGANGANGKINATSANSGGTAGKVSTLTVFRIA